MLIAAKDILQINRLKEQLSSEFDMKNLGPARKILGMEIVRDRKKKKLWLSQCSYIKKVLARFNMESSKPVKVPLAGHFKLSSTQSPSTDSEINHMKLVPYANAVGSIMYAMVCTRPDLAHAVGVVSRFMANPGKAHWEAVKWILRYLRGSVDRCLEFGCASGDSFSALGYVDSDYGGDLDNRRSTTGYVFTVGSSSVSWRSILQDTVALSTTEAEYMAAAEAAKEAKWLKSLLCQLGVEQSEIFIECDNSGTVALSKDLVLHSRTKHIDIRFNFLKLVDKEQIFLRKIHTSENAADMMTKALTFDKFRHCLNILNIVDR